MRPNYLNLVIIISLIIFGGSIYFVTYLPSPPIVSIDAAYYQHVGWYTTTGSIPYVHMWIMKPPLVPILEYGLATIAFGNMKFLHWLNVILTSVAGLIGICSVAKLVELLTSNKRAGLLAGLTMLTLPAVYIKAAMGFRTKIFALCFGMMGLLLQWKKRPFLSGGVSTVALGFWQFGIVFPLMSLIKSFEYNSGSYSRRTFIGILLTGGIILVPIFYWGAFPSMVVETIITPILLHEELRFFLRLKKIVLWTNFAFLSFLAGFLGLLLLLKTRKYRRLYWLWTGFLIILTQVLFVDLDGPADLILMSVFVSIGFGILSTPWSSRIKTCVTIVLLILIFTNAASELNLISETGLKKLETKTMSYSARKQLQRRPRPSYLNNLPTGQTVNTWNVRAFWLKSRPSGCYYRQAHMIEEWMNRSGNSLETKICGRLGDVKQFLESEPPENDDKIEDTDIELNPFED